MGWNWKTKSFLSFIWGHWILEWIYIFPFDQLHVNTHWSALMKNKILGLSCKGNITLNLLPVACLIFKKFLLLDKSLRFFFFFNARKANESYVPGWRWNLTKEVLHSNWLSQWICLSLSVGDLARSLSLLMSILRDTLLKFKPSSCLKYPQAPSLLICILKWGTGKVNLLES